MLDTFTKEFNIGDKVPPNQYSALTLAYIGDAVYDLFVRTYLLRDANFPVNQLHKAAIRLVCANAQSNLYQKIKDILTEEEIAVYKRGRNSNLHRGGDCCLQAWQKHQFAPSQKCGYGGL